MKYFIINVTYKSGNVIKLALKNFKFEGLEYSWEYIPPEHINQIKLKYPDVYFHVLILNPGDVESIVYNTEEI